MIGMKVEVFKGISLLTMNMEDVPMMLDGWWL
jgi:hypothetical protein